MKSQITYWKETDGKFLGYLNDYPDHWTQGDDLDDLKAHLRDLYHEFSAHDLPGIKKMEEIEVGSSVGISSSESKNSAASCFGMVESTTFTTIQRLERLSQSLGTRK